MHDEVPALVVVPRPDPRSAVAPRGERPYGPGRKDQQSECGETVGLEETMQTITSSAVISRVLEIYRRQ